MKRYEFLEHTADVRVRIYGVTSEELFENAAFALFSLLTDYKPQRIKERTLTLDAEIQEDLLVHWLNELITLFFTYKFLPAQYSLKIEEKPSTKVLQAVVSGEDFDPYKNKINMEIKAATYHEVKIEKDKGGFKVDIIFDV